MTEDHRATIRRCAWAGIAAVLAVIVLAGPAAARSDVADACRAIVSPYASDGRFPGVALVARGDTVLFEGA